MNQPTSVYEPAFFTVPYRIKKLPGLTLAYFLFYETIFEFIHRGKECFLSNDAIKDRTGITSSSTIKDAFAFFEKHNELKRIVKDIRGKLTRCIVIPERSVETDVEVVDKSIQIEQRVSVQREGGSRSSEREGLGTARHNSLLINKKNNNIKNSCSTDVEQSEFFDDFWKMYKRKQKKSEAKKIWIKRNLDKKAPEIIYHVEKRNDMEWKTKDLCFIPCPDTFLRNEGWTDALIEPPKPKVQKGSKIEPQGYVKGSIDSGKYGFFNDNH